MLSNFFSFHYPINSKRKGGICGGMAMCASCQCYVLSPETPLPEKSDDEEAMLSEALNVKDNSRLGCQIHISTALEGLAVELAPEEF